MKIQILGERPFRLNLPGGLVLNGLGAGILASKARDHGVAITHRQAAALIKALNRYRRTHPDWVLVEVECADGDRIEIKL